MRSWENCGSSSMRVAIAGYGIEGAASYQYWSAQGNEVVIFDERQPSRPLPEGARAVIGEDAFTQMDDFDLVIRTASLRPDKIKTTGKVWSATNEFFAKCPVPIIGVTGTKGKGTTATLISKILEAAGYKTWLVGNIGVPALDVLEEITNYKLQITNKSQASITSHQASDNAVVIFELSSFQLWDIEASPQTAVVLMMEPDHLDVHRSMEEYVAAKARIGQFQDHDDLMIYHPTNTYSEQIAKKSPATKKQYMKPTGAYIIGGQIVVGDVAVALVDEVSLIGEHNLENICAAITAAWHYTKNVVAMKKAITTFKGLPHRLEFVRTHKGVSYYNDSQATGVGSCLAALASFPTQKVALVLGGSEKGVDMSPVVAALDPARHHVILIGQSSKAIASLLSARDFSAFSLLGKDTTMAEIVDVATSSLQGEGVVLLSPAHASFDMFASYQDRGDQFKNIVRAL